MTKTFAMAVSLALIVTVAVSPVWAVGDKVRGEKAAGPAGDDGGGDPQVSRGTPVGESVKDLSLQENTKGKNGQSGTTATLSPEEIEDLVYLREEEKLARDVYLYLFDTWGQWIFENIAASEQQHMDAVETLLDRYGIDDPVDEDIEGEFTNKDLGALYETLINTGDESAINALLVGATIEDMDIHDILQMLAITKKPDLISVYENLMKGSRNHLRSFCSLLATMGESYTAQYLTQEEVDAILDTPKETGP